MVHQIFSELDWRSFEKGREQPRVSRSQQHCRDVRFLVIPAWASLGLSVFSAILHFSISQTQDIVQIYVEPATVIVGFTYSKTHKAWGLFVYIAPCVLWACLMVYHMLPMKGQMPIMYGSGRVVLASCYALRHDEGMPAEGLQWGDIGEDESGKRRAGLAAHVAAIKESAEYI